MLIRVSIVTLASISKKSRIAVRLLPERYLPLLVTSSNIAYRVAFNKSVSDTKYLCRHLKKNHANISEKFISFSRNLFRKIFNALITYFIISVSQSDRFCIVFSLISFLLFSLIRNLSNSLNNSLRNLKSFIFY